MHSPALETLILFLSQKEELVNRADRILFQRASYHPWLDARKELLRCRQTYWPAAEELRIRGFQVSRDAPDGPFPFAIFLPGVSREENCAGFASCMEALDDGGHLVCAMENGLGAARFEGYLEKLSGEIESFSKNKCRAFMARKGGSLDGALLREWLAAGEMKIQPASGLYSCPGIFAWDRLDAGSALLIEHLPPLSGAGADFGAGNGALSAAALKASGQITSIDLFDVEALALRAAELNLRELAGQAKLAYEWRDLIAKPPPASAYDWIISNPPFHRDGRSTISVGQAFIAQASRSLKPGGTLWMVANEKLPYEKTLEEAFARSENLTRARGYKILRAVK